MSKYLNVIPQYIARNKKLNIKGLTYKQYLASNEWYWLKEYAKKQLRFNYCNCCGKFGKLHFHHKTYKNINKPIKKQLDSLVTLCPSCHLEVHRLTQDKNKSLGKAVKCLRKSIQNITHKTIVLFGGNIYF